MTEQGRLPFEDTEAAADLDWLRDWARVIRWTFARSVPDQPREYWRAGGDLDYPMVRDMIRRYGTSRIWPQPGSTLDGVVKPRRCRYVQVGDFGYWVGSPGFVNRARSGRID